MEKPGFWRVFCAIPLDQAQCLLGAQQSLYSDALWQWQTPERLHLTLAFCDRFPDSSWQASLKYLRRVLGACPAGHLTLHACGAFPNIGKPRCWVAYCDSTAILKQLYAICGSCAKACGWSSDTRPFEPHVTLATGLRSPPPQASVELLEPIQLPVDRIIIVRSHLEGHTSRYETLASIALAESEDH